MENRGTKSPGLKYYFRSVIEARVEQKGTGTLVDIEKIRHILEARGVGVIMPTSDTGVAGDTKIITNSSVTIHDKEVVSKIKK